MTNELDLISQKTSEYSELPGMILGLDGWILRSLPVNLREQFLNGYLKLLRIAFHPDRFSGQRLKNSRQTFLQSAGESISFMLSDEYAFESTVDHIPSKKNPIISLKNIIQSQSDIILMTDEREAELKSQLAESIKECQKQRNHSLALTERLESLEQYVFETKARLAERLHEIPVPIRLKRFEITGRWVEVNQEPKMVNMITFWAKTKSPKDISHRFEELLEKKSVMQKVDFRRGISSEGKIISAFSPYNIVEIIKARLNADNINEESCARILETLGTRAIDINESIFSLPFIYSGMLLFIEKREKEKTFYKLLLCSKVDAGQSVLTPVVKALSRDLTNERKKHAEIAERRKNQFSKMLGEIFHLRAHIKQLQEGSLVVEAIKRDA